MSLKKIPIIISLFFTVLVGIVNIYNGADFELLTIIMLVSLIIFYFIGILLKKYIIELLKLIKKYIIEQIKANNNANKQKANKNASANKTKPSVINYVADESIDLEQDKDINPKTNNTRNQDLDSELNSIVNVVKEKM